MSKKSSEKSNESSRLNGLSLLRVDALLIELREKASQPDEVLRIADEIEAAQIEAKAFLDAVIESASSLQLGLSMAS